METKTIEKKELSELKGNINTINVIRLKIGEIEEAKSEMLGALVEAKTKLASTKKELETKYGSININVDSGEYTQVENESNS